VAAEGCAAQHQQRQEAGEPKPLAVREVEREHQRGSAAERAGWDDGRGFVPSGMYTDWTAVILLLLTAAPLAVVVTTAAFFIWRQKRQQLR
jgi:hypothetical protein